MPALLVLSGPPSVHADLSRTRQEIAHRLHFIAAADGRFIRNGKDYDARAAHEPIRKKYDDLQSRIRSAEDFIRLAASRRNMSVAP